MGDALKVLFICSGNVFRSMSAEYCLKNYLKKKGIKNVKVSSAGTTAHKQKICEITSNALENFNILCSEHKQRKLTKKILEESDVVIAMSTDHQTFIWNTFGVRVHAFHEFSRNKNLALLDVEEKDPKIHSKPLEFEKYVTWMVNHIHKLTPKVFETIQEKYLLFEEIVKGKHLHLNKFNPRPFLYESQHTIAFMALSIPEKEDGHVLVIPKKRYSRIEKIPTRIQNDLTKTISIIGRALLLSHEGYNIVLNNGEAAEQTIFHTHYHIVPRDKGDGIHMKVWKEKKLTQKKFADMNTNYRKNIRKVIRNN